MKSSCIPHPARDPMSLIRLWQLVFTDGNQTDAALLNLFEHGHNRKMDEMESKPLDEQSIEDLYQHYTEDELAEQIMMVSKDPKTIRASIDRLVALGAISVHKNPDKRFKYDTTKHYLFNPSVITDWLKNTYEGMSECDKSIKAYGRVSRFVKQQIKKDYRANGRKYNKKAKCLDTNCHHCGGQQTIGKNPECTEDDTIGKIPECENQTVGKNPLRAKKAENTPKMAHDREISLNESLEESIYKNLSNRESLRSKETTSQKTEVSKTEEKKIANASEQSSHSVIDEKQKEKPQPSEAQLNHRAKVSEMVRGCGMNIQDNRSAGKCLQAIKKLNELYGDEVTPQNIRKACLALKRQSHQNKFPQPSWVVEQWPNLISASIAIDTAELAPFKTALKDICVPQGLDGWDAEDGYLTRLANRIRETGGTPEQITNFRPTYWNTFAQTPPTLKQLAGQWQKYTQQGQNSKVVQEYKRPRGVTEEQWQRAQESCRRLAEEKAARKKFIQKHATGERSGLNMAQIMGNIAESIGVAA